MDEDEFHQKMAKKKLPKLPSSISFSPAGLLHMTFHFGVSSVLQELMKDEEDPDSILLTGVSAGCLCATAIKMKVDLDVLMKKVQDVSLVKVADYKNVSLVDELEKFLPNSIKEACGGTEGNVFEDYDMDMFQQRCTGLRIGICHRRTKLYRRDEENKAFCYVGEFRDADDLVAACILSSYVPISTGPLRGKNSSKHGAIARANTRVKEMEALGLVKIFGKDEPVVGRKSMTRKVKLVPSRKFRESYIDGAFGHCLPVTADDTLLVCPFYVSHEQNNLIAPTCECKHNGRKRLWLKILPKELRFVDSSISMCDCNVDSVKLGLSRRATDEDVAYQFNTGRGLVLKHFGMEEEDLKK